MSEHSPHIGPYHLERRISTSEDRALFFAPRAHGTRIPYDAAIYCLHHTHQQAEDCFALQDDFEFLQQLNPPVFPQIIQLYERQFAYAREWIEGASLREMLVMIHQSKTLLPQDTIYDIMFEIVSGYEQLQRQRPSLMHGRLNWDHVLLGVDGRICIIGLRAHSKQNLFSFSSPEQATGTFFDWRSDQWSMGAIFTSLLLKESLYTGRPNPEYAASKGDVTHWLDRVKVAYPSAHRIVAKMLHPAAGERYTHHSYILRDLERLKERYPNSKRLELGQALAQWLLESPQQATHSVDAILPKRVLPQSEPKLQQYVLEVTEQFEPEIESYIEVTQFNTPKVELATNGFQMDEIPEPILTSTPRLPNALPKGTAAPTEIDDDDNALEVTEVEIDDSGPPAPPHLDPEPIEPSVSEHSLQTGALAEASLVGDVFAAQQRAIVLMILNALFLLGFIWQNLL